MKNSYENMNKMEKKELYKKFKEKKSELVKKMNRMFLICCFGIVYSVAMFGYDFFYNRDKLGYILDLILFVFCIFGLLKTIKTKKTLLINFSKKK